MIEGTCRGSYSGERIKYYYCVLVLVLVLEYLVFPPGLSWDFQPFKSLMWEQKVSSGHRTVVNRVTGTCSTLTGKNHWLLV